jgi:sterol desaturase/sphingolipid hydroxylase (fatty acid hydroxylase superfamily)
MGTEDARRALEEIAERRRQVEATVAAPLPWWYLAGSAAGVWMLGASQDFRNSATIMAAGLLLFISTNTGLERSRRVRSRGWGRGAWLVGVGAIAALLVVDIGVIMAARLAHAPRPNTIAGAAMAVTFVVLAVWTQRTAHARLRDDQG